MEICRFYGQRDSSEFDDRGLNTNSFPATVLQFISIACRLFGMLFVPSYTYSAAKPTIYFFNECQQYHHFLRMDYKEDRQEKSSAPSKDSNLWQNLAEWFRVQLFCWVKSIGLTLVLGMLRSFDSQANGIRCRKIYSDIESK